MDGGGLVMRPEKGYASVCGCTVCLGVYVEGGDKFSSGSSLRIASGVWRGQRFSLSVGKVIR